MSVIRGWQHGEQERGREGGECQVQSPREKRALRRGGATTPLHSGALFFFRGEGWKVKRRCVSVFAHSSSHSTRVQSTSEIQSVLEI